MRALSVLLLVALALAGCSSEPKADGSGATDEPSVITDPADLTNSSAGSHIHDYWGGAAKKLVLDMTHPGGNAEGAGPGLASGESVPVHTFLPAAGDVVPQGTVSINVTWTWTDAAGDSYTNPQLWVKSAADVEPRKVVDIQSGDVVEVRLTAADADLPHQILSAWVFELRMGSPDPMPLRFKGSVHAVAEATRGLPLPVFPAHPDPWLGAEALALLDEDGSFSYFEDPVDHGCNGQCGPIHHPGDGIIVPHNASFVLVHLQIDPPLPVSLLYHSTSGRTFVTATAETSSQTEATYRILVEGDGDGPYARQSQWEFRVIPQPGEPIEIGAGGYRITAAAER